MINCKSSLRSTGDIFSNKKRETYQVRCGFKAFTSFIMPFSPLLFHSFSLLKTLCFNFIPLLTSSTPLPQDHSVMQYIYIYVCKGPLEDLRVYSSVIIICFLLSHSLVPEFELNIY